MTYWQINRKYDSFCLFKQLVSDYVVNEFSNEPGLGPEQVCQAFQPRARAPTPTTALDQILSLKDTFIGLLGQIQRQIFSSPTEVTTQNITGEPTTLNTGEC